MTFPSTRVAQCTLKWSFRVMVLHMEMAWESIGKYLHMQVEYDLFPFGLAVHSCVWTVQSHAPR